MTKLFWAAALLLAVTATAQQQSFHRQTGIPICLSGQTDSCYVEYTRHVNGKPIHTVQLVVSQYRVNQGPPWPIGLWIYNEVQVDSGKERRMGGSSVWCQYWFDWTAQKEQHGGLRPWPYIELLLDTSAQTFTTDEGATVYPPGAASCSPVLNLYKP